MRAALPGWKSAILRALERRLGLERGVQRLDDALARGRSRPRRSRRRARARPAARRRQVDARDLEQRDPPTRPRRRCGRRPRRGSAGAASAARCSSTEIGSGSFQVRVVVGAQARRVRLGEAEADERVLDAAAELLLARQRAEHRAPRGQRERDVLEPEARDLLDDVDLAGHVAGAPGRRDDARRRRGRSRAARAGACWSAGRRLDRRSPRRRARAGSAITGRAGSSPCTSVCGGPARAGRARAGAASRGSAAGPARYGSTPFSQRFEPSVRRRSRSDVRKMPCGSKFAASSSTVVVASPISVSSPPMIPASATDALGVGDHQVVGRQLALDAVERAQPLARRARGGRRSARRASVV